MRKIALLALLLAAGCAAPSYHEERLAEAHADALMRWHDVTRADHMLAPMADEFVVALKHYKPAIDERPLRRMQTASLILAEKEIPDQVTEEPENFAIYDQAEMRVMKGIETLARQSFHSPELARWETPRGGLNGFRARIEGVMSASYGAHLAYNQAVTAYNKLGPKVPMAPFSVWSGEELNDKQEKIGCMDPDADGDCD